MKEIIARNIELYIKAQGRRKEWIRDRMGIDQSEFDLLLAGDTTHLEEFAKFFRKDAQYFMDVDFVPPETIQEKLEKLKNYEPEPVSDVMFMASKLEGMAEDMYKLEGLFSIEGMVKNETALKDIKQLVELLETKTDALLLEAEKKEIELELNK